ncbi:MAG: Clp protease ClpB [Nitritalea sp.]
MAQAKLEKLLEDRAALHQAWKSSEANKSGIFGNRTKKDMQETNAWLERILQKDNLIIQELELQQRIVTSEMTYEKNDYKFIVQRLERENRQLKQHLARAEDLLLEQKKTTSSVWKWLTWTSLFLLVLLMGNYWRMRQRLNPSAER